MTAYLLANHFLNFAAPALFLALGLVVVTRWLPLGRRPGVLPWRRQVLVLLAVNLVVSTAAFIFLGQDGKLMGFAAMVAAAALTQWCVLRAWQA